MTLKNLECVFLLVRLSYLMIKRFRIMESNFLRSWKTVAEILEWIVGNERDALLREREACFVKLVGFKEVLM